MPFVSDRWGVEVRWFHDKTTHAFPNSNELSVYTTFGACDGSKNFNRFFRLLWSLCFARIGLNPFSGKILYHDSVCSVIHHLNWGLCDQPLSSHQTFLLAVELRQCASCKEPLSFWFSSRLCNFGLMGSEFKYFASFILIPLSLDVPNLSPEKCVRVHAPLSANSSNHSGRSRKRSSEFLLSSLFLNFCFGFLRVICTSLLEQVRHFLLQLELLTNPAKPMLTTNCFQNW